jgi:hypothetical protein
MLRPHGPHCVEYLMSIESPLIVEDERTDNGELGRLAI